VPDPGPADRPAGPAPGARRRGRAALAFALAALASCWHPLAAPFGLVVGIAAAVLALRALRASRPRRRLPLVGLGIATVAAVASGVVLALTAGAVGIELPGEPVVKGRTQAELERVLGEEAERTRDRRERALRELERGPGGASRSQGGAPAPGTAGPARDGGAR
jgi:hypothetical protein